MIETKKQLRTSYLSLFRYASPLDILFIILGTLCAMISGAALPIMTVVFGDIMQSFYVYSYQRTSQAQADVESDAYRAILYFSLIGVGMFISSYGQLCFWMISGENQAKRIRELYFKAILRQDIGWFDQNSTGELTTRIVSDTAAIQEGISDKIGLMIQFTCTFLGGFVIAFIKGWKLALVLCSVFPLLASAAVFMSWALSGGSSKSSDAYASAGSIAQQAISSIKTIAAFGGQEREAERYDKHLVEAEKSGIKKAFINGAGVAFIQGLIFLVYALGFWYGNKLVIDSGMKNGDVLNTFFAIVIGAFSLGQATPYLAVIGNAQGAAYKVFETLDRISPIDAFAESGTQLEKLEGNIEFRNIEFHYPTRTDVPILKNFNLEIKAGQTIALVGTSGSGKSTIVKLLERFYNPISGDIFIDQVNIKDINVKWLRQQIGMVAQEPTLFETSIRQNLLYGLTESIDSLTHDEINQKIEHALKMANAWDFIQSLPDGIDTNVGESGSMLSGGQKQRIAIARSLMKNPKILLLDEATSALDTTSERIVQEALDKASQNRTTIVIAHRLSTIKNANLIVVMNEGKVVESGTHNQLLERKGVYFELTQAQKIDTESHQEPVASPQRSIEEKTEKSPSEVVLLLQDKKSPLSSSMNSLKRKKLLQDKKEKEKQNKLKLKVDISRIMQLNRPEWWMFALGFLAAACNGVVMPLFAILFSKIFNSLGAGNEANFWAGMFVVLAIAAFLSNFTQISLFKYAGEKLTKRLRNLSFRAILRQEMGFFDDEQNSTGVITSRLAEDANLVQGMTGATFGAIIQAVASLVAGLAIAFVNSWRLAFVIIGVIPFMGISGYFQFRILTGYGQAAREAYEEAGQVACEAIENIRTVITLTLESNLIERYHQAIQKPHKTAVKGAAVSSIGYAFSQGVIFWGWALAFYYGSRLLFWDINTSDQIITTMFSIIFTATSAGQISNFTPDAAKAKLATINIFELLDRVSLIDYNDSKGQVKNECNGKAILQQVEFSYPIRPDTLVLKGLDLEISPSKTVALVGASGCGKSTVLGILERWYDIASGKATVDDVDVKDWNLASLRSHMALVGQEPVLFNTSIRENIAYGLPGEATQLQIEEAAKMANIHQFILELPSGYDTIVGEKGGQLSGGQKQRVAIARALIRNPKILLLDEATSALDSESEKVVQEALNVASKGRTTLVIAHRLSTIQHADQIVTLKNGKVFEIGTHQQLIANKGLYYELSVQQSLEKRK